MEEAHLPPDFFFSFFGANIIGHRWMRQLACGNSVFLSVTRFLFPPLLTQVSEVVKVLKNVYKGSK